MRKARAEVFSAARPYAGFVEAPSVWLLRLGALLVPLSEGGAQTALLGALVLHIPAALRSGGWARPLLATRRTRTARWLLAAGFAGWVLVGLAGMAVSDLTPRSSALNKLVLAVTMLLGMALVTRSDGAELKRLLGFLLAGTALASLAGLAQLAFGSFPGERWLEDPSRPWRGQLYIPGTQERAATGTLRNRMKFAEMLIFAIAACSAAVAANRSRWRLAAVAAGVALLVMLGLTFTKASLGGIVLAVVGTQLLERSGAARRLLWPALGAGLVLGVAASIYAGASLPWSPSLPATDMWTTRRYIWQHALLMFGDRPVLGTGLGTYARAAVDYYDDPAREHAFTLNAHSQHLTALVEGGAVGFAFWVLVCGGIGLALAAAWRREVAGPLGALRHLATFYLLALAPMSLVHDVLFHPVAALLFWSSVGVSLAVAAAAVPGGGHQERGIEPGIGPAVEQNTVHRLGC